jgi:hypothetical protein
MATGAPDWVRQMVISVIVNNLPVAPSPSVNNVAGDTGRYSGTAQTYQTVASWTVATGKVGELKEILILSSDFTKTHVQITVADVVYTTDWLVLSAIPLIWEDLKLEAGAVVLIETKSTDGTSITVDAAIVGKEIG